MVIGGAVIQRRTAESIHSEQPRSYSLSIAAREFDLNANGREGAKGEVPNDKNFYLGPCRSPLYAHYSGRGQSRAGRI